MDADLIGVERSVVACPALKFNGCVASAERVVALRLLVVSGRLYLPINPVADSGAGSVCCHRHTFAMVACLVRLYREPECSRFALLALGTELTA